mgnify:CR=1 FL=1
MYLGGVSNALVGNGNDAFKQIKRRRQWGAKWPAMEAIYQFELIVQESFDKLQLEEAKKPLMSALSTLLASPKDAKLENRFQVEYCKYWNLMIKVGAGYLCYEVVAM